MGNYSRCRRNCRCNLRKFGPAPCSGIVGCCCGLRRNRFSSLFWHARRALSALLRSLIVFCLQRCAHGYVHTSVIVNCWRGVKWPFLVGPGHWGNDDYQNSVRSVRNAERNDLGAYGAASVAKSSASLQIHRNKDRQKKRIRGIPFCISVFSDCPVDEPCANRSFRRLVLQARSTSRRECYPRSFATAIRSSPKFRLSRSTEEESSLVPCNDERKFFAQFLWRRIIVPMLHHVFAKSEFSNLIIKQAFEIFFWPLIAVS